MHGIASMAVRADPAAFEMSENAGWLVKILVKNADQPGRIQNECTESENEFREPTKGFEPPTRALRKRCSTPELRRLVDGIHSQHGWRSARA